MKSIQKKPEEQRGLECRKCGCRHFICTRTRPQNGFIIRVKECRHCGWRVQTRELPVEKYSPNMDSRAQKNLPSHTSRAKIAVEK